MQSRLLPILKTVGTTILSILITALVQQYAPKLTAPVAGVAAGAALAKKSPFSPPDVQ